MTPPALVRRSVPLVNWHCAKCGHLLGKVGPHAGPISVKCGKCGDLNIIA